MPEPPESSLSQHPDDRLIRELIATGRAASGDEVRAILGRIATASFSTTMDTVRREHRGLVFGVAPLQARETSLRYHLFKRIVVESDWHPGVTEAGYLADLQRIARCSSVRVAVYLRRGGPVAFAMAPAVEAIDPAHLVEPGEPNVCVIYSADRGIIVTGYRFTRLAQLGIPEDARWLTRL